MNSKMKKLIACLTVLCTMGLGIACGDSGDPVDTGSQPEQSSPYSESSVESSKAEESEESRVESSEAEESKESGVESSEAEESKESGVESSEAEESEDSSVESSETEESEDSSVESSEDGSSEEIAQYTVQFVDWNDEVISAQSYEEGATVAIPDAPTREADEEYTYTFAGWDKEVVAATENVTYKATYSKTAIEYNVTFKADGVEVGEAQKYSVENKEITVPEVPGKAHYTGAWEEYILATGDVVVNAVYTPVDYTITFLNGEEEVEIISFNVENNDKSAPSIPEKTGYTGAWDEYSFTTFEDQTVSVNYTANEYTITYDANGGTVEPVEQTVTYDGAYALATASGAKFYQEFIGWQDENGNVCDMEGEWKIASDVTLTAIYSNAITFDSMTEVPSYLQNGGRASLAIVDGNGGKVLQATSENNDQGNVRIMMPLSYMAEFFEDPSVQYMAFDLKLPEGATTGINSIMYHNLDQTNYTAYENGQFDAPPTDAPKSYYLPRSVYETWVANGKTEGRFLNVQAGITQGASYWIDNIRPVTADEYIADVLNFESGAIRTNNPNQPLFYAPSDMTGWQLGFSNANEATAKFTSEIVSSGNRALQFTKYSGDTSILMCHFADPSLEVAMREAGYISFDLYVPEGSDAKIVKVNLPWYGTLQQGWNTIYEKVDATNNELIRFTDTTASTYVIDNFRLLTEDEYNKAKFGFEAGGVIRDNNSNDDTTSGGWAYYYAGWDKANNKATIQVNEGTGENDMTTLSNVRFATEQAHGGVYSLAFDKEAGYMSLGMAADSAMYAAMKNGFTFWIYSTTEIDGTLDHILFNGSNQKLNGGEGVKIEANTWTQITVTAADINSTGRFLILQGATEGTIYLDDFQPLPAANAV